MGRLYRFANKVQCLSTIPVEPSKMQVFPNPSADIFSLNFSLERDGVITIKIYDTRGSLVQQWKESNAKAGQNIFSFSTYPLSQEVYVVSIESNGKVILKSKVVKN